MHHGLGLGTSIGRFGDPLRLNVKAIIVPSPLDIMDRLYCQYWTK
jgi:hypothetical protein